VEVSRLTTCWVEAPKPGGIYRPRIRSAKDTRQIETIPWVDLLPSWTILGMLQLHAAASPDKTAIVVVDPQQPTRVARRINYRELATRVRLMARQLQIASNGARPVVSILTPLVPEAFIASWAGATVGVANPINPFLRIDHVAQIMNTAGTTVLVCGTPADGPGAWNDIASLKQRVPTLQAVWFANQLERAGCGDGPVDEGPLSDLCEAGETATLLHTGGTTAAPKLVCMTQSGQLLNAWCCGGWLGSRADQVVAVGMPYFHVAGTAVVTLNPLVFGQTMVFISPQGFRNPQIVSGFWDIVEAHGITMAGSAPTTAAALVAESNRSRPSSDLVYWSGGATVPIQVAREFAERFGVNLYEGWGMTEVQGALITNPSGVAPRLGSIGIPFPYHRVCCAVSGDGEPGRLAVSGPCVTPGYLDAARNQDLFLQDAGREASTRWLDTGDLCTIDDDGYVWLRGRAKDLIVRSAHNIDPLMIEHALGSHPAVLHAAAIGEPDVDKGEMPVAYVQLRAGHQTDENQLLAHCRREITERAAIPRVVRILDAMPLTAVGKIFKPALRVDAISQCVSRIVQKQGVAHLIGIDVRESGGGISVVLKPHAGAALQALADLRQALERFTFRVEVEPDHDGS
jgi:fatty-acyl-CoA synthase